MKAVVMRDFGGPEQLVLEDVVQPAPEPGWVVVKLRASALNWHDVLVRRGQYRSPLPHTPGADGAGIRTDTGEEVVILPSLGWGANSDAPGSDFTILGDHVAGTYAEYVSVPAECLAPKPTGYTWEQAAALPLAGVTAYRALVTRAALTRAENLLIVGAGGGVSTMSLALAKAIGANVFVSASSEEKLASAREAGAVDGVLHTDESWPERAKALSPGGKGFDVVLDPVGLWQLSVRALRPGGRLAVLGANVAQKATLDVRAFFFGQYNLLGTTMGSPADFLGLLELVSRGDVDPPRIAAIFRLAEAAAAHRMLESGREIGKIVLSH